MSTWKMLLLLQCFPKPRDPFRREMSHTLSVVPCSLSHSGCCLAYAHKIPDTSSTYTSNQYNCATSERVVCKCKHRSDPLLWNIRISSRWNNNSESNTWPLSSYIPIIKGVLIPKMRKVCGSAPQSSPLPLPPYPPSCLHPSSAASTRTTLCLVTFWRVDHPLPRHILDPGPPSALSRSGQRTSLSLVAFWTVDHHLIQHVLVRGPPSHPLPRHALDREPPSTLCLMLPLVCRFIWPWIWPLMLALSLLVRLRTWPLIVHRS